MSREHRKAILDELSAPRVWMLLVAGLLFLLAATIIEIETSTLADLPWFAQWKTYASLSKEVGFACIIACIVAVVIERTSRSRLEEEFRGYQQQISNDVLYAVMQKQFPSNIWKEIDETILSVDFIRTQFHAAYEFSEVEMSGEDVSRNYIRVDNDILYVLKNIGARPNGTHVGIRFRSPENSPETGGLEYIKIDGQEVDAKKTVEGVYSVYKTSIQLDPGEEVSISIRYHMVKRRIDYEVWTSMYPTGEARIDLISNIETLAFSAEALQRYPVKAIRTDASGRFQCWEFQRPILPFQGIMIFWHEKESADPVVEEHSAM